MPELGYLQRGFKQQVPSTAHVQPGALNTVLDYFEGALLGRFDAGHGKVQPHFLAGITYGYLLGVRQYFQPTQGEKGKVVTSDPGDSGMNRWNLGLSGGAGLTIKAGESAVFVEGRYDHGLSGLWDDLQLTDLNGNVIGKLNSYDRTFLITVGWVFPLSERQKSKDPKAAPATK